MERTVRPGVCRALSAYERRQGRYEEAIAYARQGVELARSYHDAARSGEEQPGDLFWQDPLRVYAEALQVEALVEEDRGSREAADRSFEQALGLLESEGFEETRYLIILSYAQVLQKRGEFERAVGFYERASELRPRIGQKDMS